MSPRAKSLLRAALLIPMAALSIFSMASEGDSRLTTQEHAELGAILADGAGNALYMFMPDQQGDSTCYDACADNWPPVVASEEYALADGLDPSLIATAERTDGTEQVTYGSWPLYTFVGDTEPGQINGHGLNDAWFLLDPRGQLVGAPVDAATVADNDAFASLMKEGAAVFSRICASCHGANGDEALASHVVILAANDRLENERRVLRRVIHGGGYMPRFGEVLSDREVAAVVTFVRNSFGNEFGPVGEEDAAANR